MLTEPLDPKLVVHELVPLLLSHRRPPAQDGEQVGDDGILGGVEGGLPVAEMLLSRLVASRSAPAPARRCSFCLGVFSQIPLAKCASQIYKLQITMVLPRVLRRSILRRPRWRAASWRSLSSSPPSSASQAAVESRKYGHQGLFQLPLLNDGEGGGRTGWGLLADEGLANAKSSVAEVGSLADELRSLLSEIEQVRGGEGGEGGETLTTLRAAATEKTIGLLQNLDDVSNELCKVVDAAELCRNVHDSNAAKRGAEEAYMRISEFMQVLNVDRKLYRSLAMVCDEEELSRGLNEEQLRLATSLREDFESHGVHLSENDRQRAVSLQGEITRLGTVFSQTIVSARGAVALPLKVGCGSWSSILLQSESTHGYLSLPVRLWLAPPVCHRAAPARGHRRGRGPARHDGCRRCRERVQEHQRRVASGWRRRRRYKQSPLFPLHCHRSDRPNGDQLRPQVGS